MTQHHLCACGGIANLSSINNWNEYIREFCSICVVCVCDIVFCLRWFACESTLKSSSFIVIELYSNCVIRIRKFIRWNLIPLKFSFYISFFSCVRRRRWFGAPIPIRLYGRCVWVYACVGLCQYVHVLTVCFAHSLTSCRSNRLCVCVSIEILICTTINKWRKKSP